MGFPAVTSNIHLENKFLIFSLYRMGSIKPSWQSKTDTKSHSDASAACLTAGQDKGEETRSGCGSAWRVCRWIRSVQRKYHCLDAPKWDPIGHSVDLLGIKNFLSCNFMLSVQIYIIYVGGRHLFLTKETLETEQKPFISFLSIDGRLN